jgi:glycosyltransferase involved in cell wall biosynthesis
VKVLHVVASYLPAVRYGGTIVSVHGLCKALAARGHDVHVYTTSVDGPGNTPVTHGVPVMLDGVTVHYFESTFLRKIYRAPALRWAMRDRVAAFDVVHTHAVYLWPLWVAAAEARRSGVPYVVSPRGMLEQELIEKKNPLMKAMAIAFLDKRALEGASAVHVTSAREAEELAAFGFSLRRVIEIPNGVDEAPAGGAPSAAIARVIAGPPYVLYLGRVNWKKGLDRLIAAMAHAPGVRLVIAGNDEERYTATLAEIADQHRVRDRVVFTGFVDSADKAALLRHAGALMLPSYSENFGNVVLESMAAGRPVIVSAAVGVADVVKATASGIVIDGDAGAFGAAITKLSSDAALGDEMGSRGREAAKRYSWDRVAGEMEALYAEVGRAARC